MRQINARKLQLLLVLLLVGSAVSCGSREKYAVDYDPDVLQSAPDDELDAQGAALEEVPDVLASNATLTPETNLEDVNDFSSPRDLFNGENLDGWTSENGGEPQGWVAENGVLKLVDPSVAGDIITAETFDDYVFQFEWRFGRECNSGVKYKIVQPNGRGWLGLEYQIQDDANVEDGKIPSRKIASVFDVLPAQASLIADQYPAPTGAAPEGEFRKGKIVVVGDKVEHWIDDQRVLAFTIGSKEWNEGKAGGKFKNQKEFGLVKASPILLQAHGYPVEFRNLTIQTLRRER